MHCDTKSVLNQRILTRSVMVFVLLATMAASSVVSAQGRRGRGGGGEEREWDPRSYVVEIDKDKNGYLDKNELSGRMREYLKKEGHNTDKPVSIKKINKRYESKLESKANDARLAEREKNRILPKFEAGDPPEKAPTFADTASVSTAPQGRLEDLYEEEIVEMVRGYMKNLDTNKDGWLDKNESERIQRYIGEDADKDGNDKFGELEIAEALKNRRERGGDRGRGGRDRGGDRGGDRGSRDRGGRDRGGNDSRTTSKNSLSSKSTGSRTPTSSTASKPLTGTTRSKYAREQAYVDSVFTKYDKDKDGFLTSDELKSFSSSMRKKLVDSDGDKKFSREEATNAFTSQGSSSSSTSSSTSSRPKSSGRTSTRGRSSRGSSKSGSTGGGSSMKYDIKGWEYVEIPTMKRPTAEETLRSQGARDEFLKLDKNLNGQVTMAEFRNGKEWTDKLAEAFYDKDENGDGVLTTDELR